MAPSVSSPLPHPSSSPHQDTLVLVNSGFKRNAASLWFLEDQYQKQAHTVSQCLCGQGGGASNGLLHSLTPFKPHPLLLPPPEPSSPLTVSVHALITNENGLKSEKFLPLLAAKVHRLLLSLVKLPSHH